MKKISLVYVLATILLFSCRQSAPLAEDGPVKSAAATESEPNTVQTYTTKLLTFDYLVQSTGKVKAISEQKVLAENNGLITVCNLRNNKQAGNGSTVLTLDTKATLLKIDKANERIYNSRLNYQSDLLSQESLLKNKSKGIRDSVYRKLKANSGLSDAESELKDLNYELSKAIVKAPFTGTLAGVKVQNGQYIRAGDELFTIYTGNDLYLETKILETDIGSIKIGQSANVIPVSGASSYKAVVEEINPMVDENGLVSVKLKILQAGGLLPGMNATATIMEPEQKCLIIPKQAVVMRSGKPVVFTLEEGVAKWNYVILGRDNGKVFEVKEGLKAGDKVIISNNLQLAHGAPVREEKR